MGQHENWFATASRHVNVSKNNKAKQRAATFGDDSPEDSAPDTGSSIDPSAGSGETTPDNSGLTSSLVNSNDPTQSITNTIGGVASSLVNSNDPTQTVTNLVPPLEVAKPVLDAVAQAVSKAGGSAEAVNQGAAVAGSGASGPAIAAAAAAQPPAAQAAFNTGVALASGAAQVVAPPHMSPAAQGGYQVAHGMAGAPPEVKAAIANTLVQNPATKAGLAAGIAAVKKSWFRRLLDWLHL